MLNEVVAAARGQAIPGGASPLIGLSVALVERGEPAQPEIIAWTLSGPSDNGSLSVPLQVADLRAMVRADEDALSLVSYALAAECRASANGGWRERRFGSAQPPDGQEIEKRLAGYQWLDSTDRAGGLLRNNRDVLLYGEDGSGKTTAATLLGSRWAGGSHGLVWLDLIDPADRDESVAYALLGMPRVQSVLVVVENVEANPAAAREVFALIRRLHSQLGVPIVILATGSQAVARQDFQLGWATVLADGRALVDAILRDDKAEGMPAEQKAQVRERAAGDAVIAKLAIGLWHEHGGILSEAGEFADLAAASLGADALGAASRVLLYKLACLSLFEIQIDQREIAPAEQAALDELLAAGMVHPNDEAYSIGPRSLGRLLVQHAQRAWADALALDPPDRVAYRYLQRAGATQIKATLDNLDLLRLDQAGAQARTGLGSVWVALRFLGDSLARQVMADPTRGDQAASAVYATLALIELGRPDAWRRSAEFVRTRWRYDSDTDLPRWNGSPTADLAAFEQLRDLMRAEHELIAAEAQGNGEPPFEPVNAERACRTWMLGVLLSLEAKAPDQDPAVVERLVRVARRNIEGGAFYPPQAPWVTAQVVLGLCLAGRNLRDDTVRQACQWLCQDQRFGGAYSNGWQNGVSGKTSDLLTTALCLSALLHAGWQNAEHLATGYQNLLAGQAGLEPSGQETELALIIEARLRNGDEWEKLSSLTAGLLAWAVRPERARDQGIRATRPGDPLSASAKTPFIAVQLWIIVWSAVNRELRQLLQDIQRMAGLGPGTGQAPPPDEEVRLPEPGASGPPLVTPVPSLRVIRRSADRLRREIEANISERARRFPELRRTDQGEFEHGIQTWQDRLRRLEIIEEEIESGTMSMEAVSSLDSLGQEIFSVGWKRL